MGGEAVEWDLPQDGEVRSFSGARYRYDATNQTGLFIGME
jgi:hypothetical protein